MKTNKLLQNSFLSAAGLLIYVSLVASLIQNGEKLFGKMDNLWDPIAFLLLFVFSALVSGLIILGYPIWLYLNQEKKIAVKLLFYTIGWLFLILIIVFLFIAIK